MALAARPVDDSALSRKWLRAFLFLLEQCSVKQTKHPFEYQAPTPENVVDITAFREQCKTMYDTLVDRLPNGKSRAMAITKLEEFSMWVNKAIVFGDTFYPHENNGFSMTTTAVAVPSKFGIGLQPEVHRFFVSTDHEGGLT